MAAVIGAFAAACANAPADGASNGTADGGIDHPSAADQLVLRVETGGGFVPVEFLFTQIPGFSLYGDGRAIATGAQIEIYPPPALPPLVQTPVSEEGVQAILRAAIDAGLEADRDLTDFGETMIADAPTTTFTLTVNGATHTTTVYALGELSEKPPGMAPDEYEARRELQAFSQRLGDIRSWLPDGSVGEDASFEPASMRLFISGYRGDEQLPQPPIEWPLAQDLGGFGGSGRGAGRGGDAVRHR
jgi:hypothetical protein